MRNEAVAHPVFSTDLSTLTTAVDNAFDEFPAARPTQISRVQSIWSEIRTRFDEVDERDAVRVARFALHAVRSTAAAVQPKRGVIPTAHVRQSIDLLRDDLQHLNVLMKTPGNPTVKKPKPQLQARLRLS